MNETSELVQQGLFAGRPAQSDDAEHLTALRNREPAAWTALFETHRDLVFRLAFSQVGDRELAEDIAGQVFLEAIEGIRRYRDRGAPLEAWLVTITRHRSLDALRKRRREAVTRLAAPHSELPAVSSALDALGVLTVEQREVIHLRFVEDLSIEQVALATGRSAGAVKSLQHRALRQLRSQLGPESPGGTLHA